VSRTAAAVFDLGGVAARWLPERRLHHLAELSGLTPAAVDQLVFASGFDDAAERGRFDQAAFTVELAGLLGIEVTTDSIAALRRAWASAYDPNHTLLRALRRLTVPRVLFTNNGPLLEAALDHELAEIGASFQHRMFSWRLGAAKPDPEAFAAVNASLDASPAEVVFFDDSEANVTAARGAGWQAHRFTTVLDAQAVLARLSC
jgi:putative hydrolase of the HAD superfamily